jgi:hypothetical protein
MKKWLSKKPGPAGLLPVPEEPLPASFPGQQVQNAAVRAPQKTVMHYRFRLTAGGISANCRFLRTKC